MIKPYYY